MATVNIYASTNDGDIQSSSSTYSVARAGGDLFIDAHGGKTTGRIGQDEDPLYFATELFIEFDTSSLTSAPLAATLSMVPNGIPPGSPGALSATASTIEVRTFDWGGTVDSGDWVAGASLGSLPLVASKNTSGLTDSVRFDFDDQGLAGAINAGGMTRFLLSSSRHRLGNTAVTFEFFDVWLSGSVQGDEGGSPRLQLTVRDASTDETLNPTADGVVNGWTTDTGGTGSLYAAIDESTASDSDYVQSPAGPSTTQYYETLLETYGDPEASSGHIVHYRYRKNVAGGGADLTVALIGPPTVAELLTENQQGIETDTTGWVSSGNCTIARTTSEALDGVGSLEITATGSFPGVRTPNGTSGFPVEPNTEYSFTAFMKAASTSRLWNAGVLWYNAAGSGLGGNSGDNVSITSAGFTACTHFATSPATAAYGTLIMTSDDATSGNVFYLDRAGVQGASETIHASWDHTNISDTWTQADQTLTGTQADSIVDYSNLSLRFIPSTTTSDLAPTFVADRASVSSNTAVTTADFVLTGMTVGNYLIIRSAADNSGGGGAARSVTVTNQSGTPIDTATDIAYQQNYDPGAASAGTTANLVIAKITATSGTVRLTYSGSVVQAAVAEEWSNIHSTSPIATAGVGSTGTGTSIANNVDPANAGDLCYAAVAVEGPSADTMTIPTTFGWNALTILGTTNATADLNQKTGATYKIAADGSITSNTITITSRDWANLRVALAPAPPTIRTQVSWANLELPAAGPGEKLVAGISRGVSTASAVLGAERPLAAVTAGVSTVAAAVGVARPLAAASAGESTVAAVLSPRRGLAAVSAGESTVVADITPGRGLAASTAGLSIVSAGAAVEFALESLTAGLTTVAGGIDIEGGEEEPDLVGVAWGRVLI